MRKAIQQLYRRPPRSYCCRKPNLEVTHPTFTNHKPHSSTTVCTTHEKHFTVPHTTHISALTYTTPPSYAYQYLHYCLSYQDILHYSCTIISTHTTEIVMPVPTSRSRGPTDRSQARPRKVIIAQTTSNRAHSIRSSQRALCHHRAIRSY